MTRDEPALLDAADALIPALAEKCLPLLPPAEKQALLNVGQPDLIWLAERTHAVWTTGMLSGVIWVGVRYHLLLPFKWVEVAFCDCYCSSNPMDSTILLLLQLLLT